MRRYIQSREFLPLSIGLILLSSCASLQISTEPVGAELSVVSASGGAPTALGKAPLSLAADKLQEILKGGPALIKAAAEGYESTSILVPTSLRGDVRASLSLKKIEARTSSTSADSGSDMNTLVRDILDAERGIIEKRFDDAQRIAVKIREKYPALAISYFLEGSIQYQKGEIQAAIASLTRGVELDPNDAVTKNFIDQIKKNDSNKSN